MAPAPPTNSIWTQMGYTPPRGPCNYKGSIISGCACKRYMLHPVKAATSFECDGCGHHASFHSMENKVEVEILKRWQQQAAQEQQENGSRSKKRPRPAIEAAPNSATNRILGTGQQRVVEELDDIVSID